MSALWLASSSPRRREILSTLGLSFEVSPSDVDETALPGEGAREHALRLARAKALDVASRVGPFGWVIGADTIVVVDGEILGKPADDADAARMIARLAGRWHEVITAVALGKRGSEGAALVGDTVVTTRVCFGALDADRVARYVATGEGRDKAGAYAVQGIGAGLVTRIEGSYTNVVGLPAAETVALLERHGALGAWP